MNRAQIERCIPHRGPMLLVDEVLEKTPQRIVGCYQFTGEEFFFQGHYPDYPLVPGVILCEACMQTGAILLADFVASGIPVATRMNDVRFRKMVRPGDTIQMEVELVERIANAFFMKAKATRDGQTVLRFEFACTAAESGDDPAAVTTPE
jgi:3-hydroxyacyl-[acyl-carrier-protein] dehydratase